MDNQLLTKELLIELYWKEHMSINTIAYEVFKGIVSPSTIRRYMKLYGIKRRQPYSTMIDELDMADFYEEPEGGILE